MTRKVPPFIFWWVSNADHEYYGPERTRTLEEALTRWNSLGVPSWVYGVCIYHEPTGTCYLWPDHPHSVKNPKRLAKKILKGGGFEVQAWKTLP